MSLREGVKKLNRELARIDFVIRYRVNFDRIRLLRPVKVTGVITYNFVAE
jgi:hypothetical protein